MLVLDLLEAVHERVVLRVGQLRGVEDVVEMLVVAEFVAQLLQLLVGREGGRHSEDYKERRDMLDGMEPITHLMTGACLARAGFNRKAAYATIAMTLAAEAPDLDTLWSIDGPIAAFQHHRGWTHTFLGLPVEAEIVVGAIWLGDCWRSRREIITSTSTTRVQDPVRWGLLYCFALIALLSHLALDWTNNYGLRPFFPFNPRWYSGDLVFIAEPVIWALLIAALIFPALLGLADREVGARRTQFRGRGWAIAALS